MVLTASYLDSKLPKSETKAKILDKKRSKKDKAVEPSEIALPASPPTKDSRKRAADSFEGDNGATKPPKTKPEKPSKKAKPSEDNVKPSKIDGHPVATAKTVPGGDMVEVEPPKPKKSKKNKGQKAGKAVASSSLQGEEGTQKGKRNKKLNEEDQIEETVESVPVVRDDETSGKASKASKSKKGAKGTEKKAVDESSIIPSEAADTAGDPSEDIPKIQETKKNAATRSKPSQAPEKTKTTSKKRKASDEVPEIEASKEGGLLDALAEVPKTLKKKAKKAKDTSQSLVDKIAEGLDTVASSVGDAVSSANKSIAEDVIDVAEGTVDAREKKKVKGKSKKKSGKRTDETENIEQEGEHDDTQGLNGATEASAVANGYSSSDDELHSDDQTAALLKGFESSDEEDVSGEEGFKAGQDIPKLPEGKKLSKQLKKIKAMEGDQPGVIYVGFVASSVLIFHTNLHSLVVSRTASMSMKCVPTSPSLAR